MSPSTVSQVVLLVVMATALACSNARPEDGEHAVARPEADPVCVDRHEGYVTPPATGVQLWYERLGARTAPVVVLLNGSDAPASFWDDGFIAPFVAAGYQVIRFDARDNGRSEWLPWPDDFDYAAWTPDDPPLYPLDAHVDDLFGLLDALAVEQAHLVGLSQGGMIAQLAAIARPERVMSLALLSTSASNSFDADLEPATPAFFQELARRSKRAGVRAMLQPITRRPLAGELTEFYLSVSSSPRTAAPEIRKMVDAGLRHAPYNARSAQGFAVASAPSRVAELHRITAPALVLHGERDAFFPHSHAVVLSERIPGARLISIPGLGHGLPIARFAPHRDAILKNMVQAGRGERPVPVRTKGCRL